MSSQYYLLVKAKLSLVIPVLRHWDPAVKIISFMKSLDTIVTHWNDTLGILDDRRRATLMIRDVAVFLVLSSYGLTIGSRKKKAWIPVLRHWDDKRGSYLGDKRRGYSNDTTWATRMTKVALE